MRALQKFLIFKAFFVIIVSVIEFLADMHKAYKEGKAKRSPRRS